MATIHRMHNNSILQGLGKLRFYYLAQISYKKKLVKNTFFSTNVPYTAVAVKSGCVSNVQIIIMGRYKNTLIYLYTFFYELQMD